MARANDKIDRQLLALLQANARETTTALAAKMGVARTTIQERIARLEANGTISGYSAVLTRDPFDDYTQAIIMIGLTQKHLKPTIERLRLLPEIRLCQFISGDSDICCRVDIPHVEDLGAILEEISEFAGVERVRSWIVLSTNFDRTDIQLYSRTGNRAIGDSEAG